MEITISKETHDYVKAFLPLMNSIMEKEFTVEQAIEVFVWQAIHQTLMTLHGAQDKETMVNFLQGLSSRHPEEVFGFMADVMKAGGAMQVQQIKEELGRTMNIFRQKPEKE